MLADIYWREPLWLLAGLFPLLVFLLRRWQQQQQLNRYADKSLQPWVVPRKQATSQLRYYWRVGLQTIAWLMFALAAAGPRLAISVDPALKPQAGATMIVVDLSRSMDADDVYPSRGQYARTLPAHWFKDSTAKLGLIIFAGHAHLLSPPTSDYESLAGMVPVLEQLQLPTHGSQLSEALQLAYQELSAYQGNGSIILLTDGDFTDNEFKEARSLIEQRLDNDYGLHILGIGSPSATALADRSGQWLMQDDQVVTTRLHETGLKQLATMTNGSYRRADPGYPLPLTEIWQPTASRLGSGDQQRVLWQELFPWLLLPGIVFYIVSLVPPSGFSWPVRLMLILLASFTALNARAEAPPDPRHYRQLAYQAWQSDNFEAAANYYAQIKGFTGRMGEGASCFRIEDYECAIKAFGKAAWQGRDNKERATAGFNLGNSYFALGDFTNANVMYRDALRYLPDNKNIQSNLAFSETVEQSVRQRLEQINAERTGRLGKGWRTTGIEPGAVLNPNVGVMLVDPETNELLTSQKDGVTPIDELIARGLNHARLTNKHFNQSTQGYRDFTQSSKTPAEEADRIALWQRLIEMEENIVSSPEKQRELPGVRPW